jgi:protein-S-isoprenylcysteine O-methyltransferase Ste14
MGIGGSIALLVIGAILAFAVKDTDLGGWLDINVVGWVLILAGAVGMALTLWAWNTRRRRTVVAAPPTRTTYVDPATQQPVVERRYSETERNY